MSENGDMETVGKFDCPDCDRKFTRQASLTKHTNSMWYKDHGPAAVQANWNKEPANSNLEDETGIEPQPPTGELEQIFDEVYRYGGTGIAGAKLVKELYAPLLAQAKEAGKREELEAFAATFLSLIEATKDFPKAVGGYIETRLEFDVIESSPQFRENVEPMPTIELREAAMSNLNDPLERRRAK